MYIQQIPKYKLKMDLGKTKTKMHEDIFYLSGQRISFTSEASDQNTSFEFLMDSVPCNTCIDDSVQTTRV